MAVSNENKTTAPSQDPETTLVLKAISQKYASLGSWQGRITEERVSNGLGGLTKFSEGKIFFARPDRFRYEITSKPGTLAASNGHEFWFGKFPDGSDKAGHIKHAKSLKDIDLDKYLSFLKGIDVQDPVDKKKLYRDFKLIEGKYEKTQLVLKLVPRDSAEIQSIEMRFMQTENYPSTIIIEDVTQNINTIRVSEASSLEKINPELFEPKFPKGSKTEEF